MSSALDKQASNETVVDMSNEQTSPAPHAVNNAKVTDHVVEQRGEHVDEYLRYDSQHASALYKLKHRYREELAEFFGTFIMMIFGNGVCAQVSLHGGKNGEYLSISFAWGFGVLFGILAAGGISGAHLNPAVTIMNAMHSGFPWRKVPGFAAAQILGAFTAAAVVFADYRSAIRAFDGGVRQVTGPQATAGIFATYPQPYLTPAGAFFSEFIATAILAIGLLSIGQIKSADRPKYYAPVAVAFLVMAIGMALGAPTGYCLNPARDLGPRLLTLVAGYGTETFSTASYYGCWVTIFGPILGAIFGGYVYKGFLDYESVELETKENKTV
ncbi:aquaporin 3 [Geranomyces variabilis]|nr:aquaporin 3 [Geranomyces variabilis]KAJ3141798.1 glycerol channel [Geranomyces variabilis]